MPGVSWACLQQGGTERRFGSPLPAHATVAETGALLRARHVVVTVDTMVAHLAGTLGVPALVLLAGMA